jgi:hypothetical protein
MRGGGGNATMNHKSTVRNPVEYNHLAQEDGNETSGNERGKELSTHLSN